jgi:glycosyltransferase involved in cell wall biosynthesis
MNKRHILFYYPSIGLGGQQTQIMQLAQALKSKGNEVSWLYAYGDALIEEASQYCQLKKIVLPRFNQSRFGVGRIINRFIYYNLLEWHLTRYVKKHNVDVVLSSNTIDSRVVNKLPKKQLIKHYRYIGGSMVQVEPHHLASYKKNEVDKYITGYFGWPAVFEELKTQDVPEHKFINLPFAVNTDKFYPLPSEEVYAFRQSLGIAEDDTVIGWIGRTALNMQLWDTLRLGKNLKERGIKNFKLLFIGGGPDFIHLQKKVIEYGLSKETILTDWVPYDEVNNYVNAMDIVPLLETDPQGGSIVREAMACGRLAISVDGPSGTQASFMKSDATVLVPSENYLDEAVNLVEKIIGNKDYINGLGREARKYVMANLRFENQANVILSALENTRE